MPRILWWCAVVVASAACARLPVATVAPAPEPLPVYSPGSAVDSFLVRLATTQGEIDVMVRSHWAPIGAAQFYEAVFDQYYDGARFFRAIRGFVVQFGLAVDPAKTAAWVNRRIADDSVTESNRRGTLVFATGGPNTRTTQLFFNLRDNARLDGMGFSPIGEIVAGMDVLDALHTGYGDGATAPQQDRITREGESYLASEFPLLDQIRTARVMRVWYRSAP